MSLRSLLESQEFATRARSIPDRLTGTSVRYAAAVKFEHLAVFFHRTETSDPRVDVDPRWHAEALVHGKTVYTNAFEDLTTTRVLRELERAVEAARQTPGYFVGLTLPRFR